MARAFLLGVVLLASCGGSGDDTDAGSFPDIIDVSVTRSGPDTYRFEVTVSSPYDSPDRYADAWRVKDAAGTVYGVRELLHDHANEQPFVRSLDGVRIPGEVTSVIVEGRDLERGWGGTTLTVDLPQGP